MFDDEELEQIRQEQDEWQGHVDRQTVKQSRTSKKILFGSMTASLVMFGFILFLVASGMVTSALVGAAGIGGFNAQIGELTGDDIAIYPAVGPTAACPADTDHGFNDPGPQDGGTVGTTTTLPQLRAEIGNATIPAGQNLTLIKDLQTPSVTGLDMVRLNVSAAPKTSDLNLKSATLYITGLEANELSLQNAQIREFFSDGSSSNPRFFDGGNGSAVLDGNAKPGEFVIRNRQGSTANAVIKGGSARAHFVAFKELSIPDVNLGLEYYQDEANATNPPATTASDTCPVP